MYAILNPKWIALSAAGDGGNEENTVPFFQATGLAPEEADVLFVEIDIQELSNLAALVADVPRERRKATGELAKGFRNGRGTTVHFRCAVGEPAERCGNFDRNRHAPDSPLSRCSSGSAELIVQIGFKGIEAGRDSFGGREFGGNGIGGLQAIAGDADHRGFVWMNATFAEELLRDCRGH